MHVSHGSNLNFSDISALVAALKACAQQKDLRKGINLHVDILARGTLRKNIFIGSTLIHMYATCGAFVKAQEVLDNLHTQNVVPWNALIAGFAQHGQGDKALGWFQKMKGNDISPDAVTYASVLKACGSIAAIQEAQEIHDEIVRRGLLANNAVLANSLVDVYAKCGMLPMAQHVLDELPVRDVVSWTALIAGYCEHGQYEDALLCYERLQQEGTSPNRVTFTCTLKACGNIGAIDKGMELHAEIVRKKLLETNCALGTAVVDMYARSGALLMAQQVFNELPLRDEVSWTALIAAYAHHGHGLKALSLFEQMHHGGFSFNSVTLACILKACGSTRAADIGNLVHAIIVREALLEGDDVLGNALVDMYAKCGALAKAQEIFEDLSVHDRVCWTALIAGYSHHGQDEKAIHCFKQMRHDGLMSDAKTLLCILQACSNIGAIEMGKEIHREIIREGFLGEDNSLGISLLAMYAKCGALTRAQHVFNELPVRDLVSWNALITGYCKHGHGEEAISCLELMEAEGSSPNEVTLLAVLQACGDIGATETGNEIYTKITQEGLYEKYIALGNASLDMYVKCGALPKAQEVFDKLSVQDLVTWNALFAGYCLNGLDQEVFNLFELMQHEGFLPDGVTFSCLLKACGSLRDAEKGKAIHVEIVRQGLLEKDSVLGNALVDMYAKCGAVEQAQQVFDRLPMRDNVGWTSLIIGYCEHGASNEALDCFQQMQKRGISLDVVTFASVLKACSHMGAEETGKEIHAQIARLSLLERDSALGSVLVNMYAKCGSLAMAQEVFDNLPTRNVITWTSFIAGYAQIGKKDAVFSLLRKMRIEGIEPNSVTYVVVLKACSQFGWVKKGHDCLECMEVTVEHYCCMVDLYGRAGYLDNAVAVIEKLPSVHQFLAWSVLLSACQKMGSVEHGQLAFWPRRGVG
ncbi:hypothetical protein GOP47_0026968 [Adiantum capillus-veneris]|nr:hypothetical protein GOP47_0026968 [Adiantum capillus-veneris]